MTEATQTTEATQPATQEAVQPTQQPADAGSLLSKSQEWAPPEKYAIKNETGDYDWKQIAQKIDEGRSHLERRLGAGEAPPKEHTGYKVEVEGVDWAEFSKTPIVDKFLQDMHKAGANNAQINAAVNGLQSVLDRMEDGKQAQTVETAAAELKKVWQSKEDFDTGIAKAFKGANAVVAQMGMTMDDIEAAGLGNNPAFLRIMAHIAEDMAEDTPINTDAAIPVEDINSMMMGEAYQNPKHPDHAKVSAKVKAYFDAKYK